MMRKMNMKNMIKAKLEGINMDKSQLSKKKMRWMKKTTP